MQTELNWKKTYTIRV